MESHRLESHTATALSAEPKQQTTTYLELKTRSCTEGAGAPHSNSPLRAGGYGHG